MKLTDKIKKLFKNCPVETKKTEIEECHGGAGWAWREVDIYYLKGKIMKKEYGKWHKGDNR